MANEQFEDGLQFKSLEIKIEKLHKIITAGNDPGSRSHIGHHKTILEETYSQYTQLAEKYDQKINEEIEGKYISAKYFNP